VSRMFERTVSGGGCVKAGRSGDFHVPASKDEPGNSRVSCGDLTSIAFACWIDGSAEVLTAILSF
jgi:hypothetical protein